MRYLVLNIFLFLSIFCYSQRVSVKSYIDSNNVKIGSQVILSLEIEKPKAADVRFPVLADTITKQIEILKKFPVDTLSNKDNILKIRQKYVLTSFDSGTFLIPSFAFLLKRDSLADTLKSEPFTLNVFSIPVDTVKKDIRDIKVPYSASITLMEILIYFLYILGIAAIVFVIIYIIRKRKKNEPLLRIPEKPKEPAYVIALRELDRLKDEKLWQQDKIKLYHSELTDIVRKYIENRFDIMAMEQTSFEILSSFNNKGLITETSFEQLKQMLITADFVKFAKALPLPDENDRCMKNAYSFVNETKDVIPLMEDETKSNETNISNETKNLEG